MLKHTFAAAGLAFATLAAVPASAEMIKMQAALGGPTEVPPTASPGRGLVDATYDTATKVLTFQGTYSGLTGPATAAHFHGPAAVGANAPVAIPVTPPTSPFSGTATLTDAQAAALVDGKMYFNVHTATNPGGEIRGQVIK